MGDDERPFRMRSRACKMLYEERRVGIHLEETEDSAMRLTELASKLKRKDRKDALPVLGVVGMSLSLAGGASAATAVPAVDTTSHPLASGQVTLNEEEVADVSLATFYVFDKENTAKPQNGLQLARGGCGCGRGCGGRGGCGRGCGWGRGCGGCGCCTPWRPWLCY